MRALEGPLYIHDQSVCQMPVRLDKAVVSEELVSVELSSDRI